MKRVITSANMSPLKNNVRTVCDAMNWNSPTFCDKAKDGYKCKWGGLNFLQQAMKSIAGGYSEMMEIIRNRDKSDEEYAAWEQLVTDGQQQMQSDLDTILERTGIECYINRANNLVIPFYLE